MSGGGGPVHDLAVIGGGLAGCATAYFAARQGVRVLLLEARDLNVGASGANAGSIHAQIPFDPYRHLGPDWARDFTDTIPLFRASIRRWAGLEAELGADLGVSLKGGLMVAGSAEDMRALEAKAALERAAGLPVEIWDAAELRRRAPFLSSDLAGAAFCPEEGKADPFRAAPAFAAAFQRLGGEIRRGAAVTGLETGPGGFTLSGPWGQARAARVVNAAGADAARVAALLGLKLAIEGHPIQVAVTEKRPQTLPWLLYYTGEKLTLKQAAEGGFLVGGGWPARPGPPPQVDHRSMLRNLALARRVMPGLGGVQIVRSWAATVNGTADWRPLLGPAPGVPGFYLNLFPWMGFTAAPAVSEAIALMALGLPAPLDLSRFLLR